MNAVTEVRDFRLVRQLQFWRGNDYRTYCATDASLLRWIKLSYELHQAGRIKMYRMERGSYRFIPRA